MSDINATVSLVTLDVNGLNKSLSLSRTIFNFMLPIGNTL